MFMHSQKHKNFALLIYKNSFKWYLFSFFTKGHLIMQISSDGSFSPTKPSRSRTDSSPNIPITINHLFFGSDSSSDKMAYSLPNERARAYSTLSQQLEEEQRIAELESRIANEDEDVDSLSENSSENVDVQLEWDMELTEEDHQQNIIYRLTDYIYPTRASALKDLDLNQFMQIIRTHYQNLHQGLDEHFQQKAILSP